MDQKKLNEVELELEAMGVCSSVLAELTTEQRRRVVRYLTEHFFAFDQPPDIPQVVDPRVGDPQVAMHQCAAQQAQDQMLNCYKENILKNRQAAKHAFFVDIGRDYQKQAKR